MQAKVLSRLISKSDIIETKQYRCDIQHYVIALSLSLSLSLSLTDGIGDDVMKEASLRHDPRSLVRVLEVTRLQGLEELPAQQLEADVHLGEVTFVKPFIPFVSKNRRF